DDLRLKAKAQIVVAQHHPAGVGLVALVLNISIELYAEAHPPPSKSLLPDLELCHLLLNVKETGSVILVDVRTLTLASDGFLSFAKSGWFGSEFSSPTYQSA
ncbi:hypothetical protein HJC23_009050, partial [Cyclotella cryptica]